MASRNLRSTVQRPERIDPRVILEATLRDVKRLAMNDKGKLKYLDALDKVLKEIYGIKGIGSRLINGKKSIKKTLQKFDFATLIRMMADGEVKSVLRTMVVLTYKAETDVTKTAKETKKINRKVAETAKLIRSEFGIRKQKSPEDVDLKDLNTFIDSRENDYFDLYDLDDDDDYDDDDDRDFLSELFSPRSKGEMGDLAKYLSRFKKSRPYDDDDEEDSFWDDDDEDDDDEESLALRKLVSITESLSDRLTALESGSNGYPRAVKVNRGNTPDLVPVPTPPNGGIINKVPGNDRDDTLFGIMSQQGTQLDKLGRSVSAVAMNMNRLNNKVDAIGNHVNDLTEAVNTMYDDLYDPDDGDDGEYGDDDIVASPEDEALGIKTTGSVTQEDVLNGFISPENDIPVPVPPVPVEEPLKPVTPNHPIPIKKITNGVDTV